MGITYSIKFLWAPVIDSIQISFLAKKIGRRRSWIIIGQFGVVVGLSLMAIFGPKDLVIFSGFALLVAFSSATQDVSIDAYRIEARARNRRGNDSRLCVRLSSRTVGRWRWALYAAAIFLGPLLIFLMAGLCSQECSGVFYGRAPPPRFL